MRYLQSTPPFPALPDARDARDKPPPASLLAAAVHAQSEGLLIAARRWTPNGLNVIFANESFCAMTGYTVAELREHGNACVHREKNDIVQLQRWQTHLQPGSTLSGEGYLTRKDGVRVYSSWSYCPVADEVGRVTHIVATYRDLTEKRRLEEALVHSQRLDAVGRLAGGVAHDFNNLLSVISGYCEILASKNSIRRHATRELEEIHQASQKAATLVRQLLAFSRRQTMNPTIVNLDRLVRDNSSILGRLLKPAKSLKLALEAGPANIRVDAAQLQQVLLNLTLNARDALRDGGKVTISTAVRKITPAMYVRPTDVPPGRYVVLSVSDNGVGMDEQTRAHLFEPFFTTKEPGKGTGLGLALVYGVVQQSGGHIVVHSAPEVGSTFDIFLPAVDKPAHPIPPPLPSLPTTLGRERVLIVEEDDVLRRMVAGILTADGYSVLAARTARAGLMAVRRADRPIDLLIAQIANVAGSEGERLARTLHASYPDLCVLSTCNPECAPLPFLSPKHQLCLTKPFTLTGLMKATRGLLDHKARLG